MAGVMTGVAACVGPAAKFATTVLVEVRLKGPQVPVPVQAEAFPVPVQPVKVDVPVGVAVQAPMVVPEP